MKVLVLGVTGSFGGAVAEALAQEGHFLRLLVRDAARAGRWRKWETCETIVGDAGDAATLLRAAEDCDVIVNGVNLPYHLWQPHMVTIADNVAAAAERTGALVVFPGNVYGLGRQTLGPVGEDAPNLATTRKGQLRIAMEDRLWRLADAGRARVLILRAGDYFGPTARNGLVDRIFGNAAAGKPIQVLGRLDVPHQWAYLPDLGRVAAGLLGRDDLRPFEVVNFAGHVARTQRAFLEMVAREAGRPGLPIRRLPWWAIRLLGLRDPVLRELLELRYLFDEAVILDDPRRRELLPDFRSTPVEEAVRATVESYRLTP